MRRVFQIAAAQIPLVAEIENQRQAEPAFQFREGGKSEPPGPGVNSAGLALFRYETTCGTVYGHTGNTPGYTQFIAATADGRRSVVVSINGQITPDRDETRFAELRRIYELAVCTALHGGENNTEILPRTNEDVLNVP